MFSWFSFSKLRVVATANAARFLSEEDFPLKILQDKDEWTSWKKRGDPVLHIEVRRQLLRV